LLVSDYHVAHYLRLGNRKARLAKTLDAAISECLVVEPALFTSWLGLSWVHCSRPILTNRSYDRFY
jgi:hypothetical protein